MVEQSIYFALGCVITALLALLFAPIFWRRALRLTRRRLQLQVPLSMQEILAERDQLRAEFAVERLRIEQAMERVQTAKALDMAEIGRRSAEGAALADQVAALRQTEQGQEKQIKRLLRDVAETGAERGTLHVALNDEYEKREMWRKRAEAARQHGERMFLDANANRTEIASLKAIVDGLEIRFGDAERALATETATSANLRSRLETAMSKAARHEKAGLALRHELDEANATRRKIEDDLTAERAALRDARHEHETAMEVHRIVDAEHVNVANVLRRERDDAITYRRKLDGDLRVANGALAEMRERETTTTLQMTALTEHKAASGSLRRELDDAKTQIRQLQDELETVRSELRDTRQDREKAISLHSNQQTEQRNAGTLLRRERDEARDRARRLDAELSAVQAAILAARRDQELASQQAKEQRLGDQAEHDSLSTSLQDELSAAHESVRQMGDRLKTTQAALDQVRQEREKEFGLQRGLQAEQASASTLLRRELEETKGQIRKLKDELHLAQTSVRDARERERASHLQRSLEAEKGRRGERVLVDRLEQATAENAALQDTLAALRREKETGKPNDVEDDTALRMNIHALGLAVAKIRRQMQDRAADVADPALRQVKEEAPRPIGVA